jgi:hypothetical protein
MAHRSIGREAREQIAAEKRQRKVEARKDRIRARKTNRRGLSHNLTQRLFDWGK